MLWFAAEGPRAAPRRLPLPGTAPARCSLKNTDFLVALPPGQYLLDTAAELGVRTSRIVQGIDRVTDDDAWNLRKRKDGVARSSWEIDIHPPDDEPAPERTLKAEGEQYIEFARKLAAGEWFDIPYGALVASGVDNLLVAGRERGWVGRTCYYRA